MRVVRTLGQRLWPRPFATMAVPSSMRAVLVRDGKGPSNALYIGDTPTPRLAEAPHSTESVLVQVKAFGLNRMDLLQREGKYPPPPGASSILGVEFSGKVVDVGSEVKDMGMGEEVFGLTTGGAYAEYVCIPASMVLKKPASLSWVEAASMPEGRRGDSRSVPHRLPSVACD